MHSNFELSGALKSFNLVGSCEELLTRMFLFFGKHGKLGVMRLMDFNIAWSAGCCMMMMMLIINCYLRLTTLKPQQLSVFSPLPVFSKFQF